MFYKDRDGLYIEVATMTEAAHMDFSPHMFIWKIDSKEKIEMPKLFMRRLIQSSPHFHWFELCNGMTSFTLPEVIKSAVV